MNSCTILGRLTKDPDVRYTQSGKTVTLFTLAVNRNFKNQNGEYEADFIPVILFNKAAELVGNSCGKGHRLLVEGRIQTRHYTDKNGYERYVTELVGNSVEFIEKKEKVTDMGQMGKDVPFDEGVPF